MQIWRVPIGAVATALLGCSLSAAAWAGDDVLEAVWDQGRTAQQQGRNAQQRVTASADQSASLLAEYRLRLKELDGVRRHHRQLRATIEHQEATMDSLRHAIDGVGKLLRDVPPLLDRMLESMEDFIGLDLPFRRDSRLERVREVRRNLVLDISESQKVRQVLELFAIESNFGRTIEAYDALIDIDQSGAPREVQVLRWGRLGMYYLSKDGREIGMYNPETQAWEKLPVRYRIGVRAALQMARNLASLDMVVLPVRGAQPTQVQQ